MTARAARLWLFVLDDPGVVLEFDEQMLEFPVVLLNGPFTLVSEKGRKGMISLGFKKLLIGLFPS